MQSSTAMVDRDRTPPLTTSLASLILSSRAAVRGGKARPHARPGLHPKAPDPAPPLNLEEPLRSSADRIDKYTAKTAPTTVGLKIAANLAVMKSEFSAVAQSLAPIEQQIQAILNGMGVPTIQYPFYLSFGRQLWALDWKGIDGATAVARATSIHGRWVGFGLDTANLKTIATDVFSIVIP